MVVVSWELDLTLAALRADAAVVSHAFRQDKGSLRHASEALQIKAIKKAQSQILSLGAFDKVLFFLIVLERRVFFV